MPKPFSPLLAASHQHTLRLRPLQILPSQESIATRRKSVAWIFRNGMSPQPIPINQGSRSGLSLLLRWEIDGNEQVAGSEKNACKAGKIRPGVKNVADQRASGTRRFKKEQVRNGRKRLGTTWNTYLEHLGTAWNGLERLFPPFTAFYRLKKIMFFVSRPEWTAPSLRRLSSRLFEAKRYGCRRNELRD